MNTHQDDTLASPPNHPPAGGYKLCRTAGQWQITFDGRPAAFQHELGALYVACLLMDPPREPVHAVALALKARELHGVAQPERDLRLEDAAAVRALWRRQRELERVIEDKHEIEPVRAEALRELEAITESLRQSPWLSRRGRGTVRGGGDGGHQAAARPAGRGGGRRGPAASGAAGLRPASARIPADALGPGQGVDARLGGARVSGLLHVWPAAGRGLAGRNGPGRHDDCFGSARATEDEMHCSARAVSPATP